MKTMMNAIKVESVSAEEADHGVTELWVDGTLIAYTIYDEGDLMLRIEPRRDGTPVAIGVRSLSVALAEVDRILAIY
jgi:hypothetical protein